MKLATALILLIVPLGVMGITTLVMSVNYDQQIGGRLKRAADATNVEIAKQELKAALEGMEETNRDRGKSHVVYYTPKADVSFWHNNIKSAYDELVAFPEDADALTVSNQLMKLREVILDDLRVTEPPNIIYYPQQVMWTMLWIIAIIAALFGIIQVIVILDWD